MYTVERKSSSRLTTIQSGDVRMIKSIISKICVTVCIIILTVAFGVGVAVLLRSLGVDMREGAQAISNNAATSVNQDADNRRADDGAATADAAGTSGITAGSLASGAAGKEEKENAAPTLTGDILPLFRRDFIKALEMSGEGTAVGTFTDTSRQFTNNENGTEILLTKDAEEHELYTVSQISINSGTIVSFAGVRIGDLLKDVNESLTRDGAEYYGDLTWMIVIDEITYSIKCNSIDNRTVASITVRHVEGDEGVEAGSTAGNNAKTIANSAEDWYALETQYWE